MKLNITVRMKNPWFWVGIGSVILTAMHVNPASLTSWQAVLDMLIAFISNPFLIVTTAIAVLSVFIDPTTAGINDSARAMTYTSPKKGEGK